MTQYYAKSFEEDFVLKTLRGKRKVPYQSIQEIVETGTIKPNTVSFNQERRLACTFLHENYLKTYRSQGLIFTTNERPDCIFPFDLVLLSVAEKIVVQYYRIKDNLHLYYNHKLIPGFEKFVFKDINKLLKRFPTLESVWSEVNRFRASAGYKELPKAKHKLIEYNEVVFNRPIAIKPVAIFGYTKESRQLAKDLYLPHFKTAKKFFESIN